MVVVKRVLQAAAGILLIALLAQPAPGASYYKINPPSQFAPVTLQAGRPIGNASTTLADLDGNRVTLEIIVAGKDKGDACRGRVFALRPDGSVYWQTQVRAPVGSTPAVADVDGDGVPEVVVGLGGIPESQCWHGGVVALNGRTGAVEWTFDTQDWLNHSPDGWRDGVHASPAIGDINGDGQLEIVFGAWDQCIYVLNGSGKPIWGELNGIPLQTHCGGHGFYNEDTVWSSAALADLTHDGKLEIIIGTDITTGNRYGVPSGGFVYVLRHDGTQLARRWLDQRIYSSPAIGDLDRDGKLDIVVGTGNHLKDRGFYVKVYNYEPGVTSIAERLVQKWHLSTTGPVFSSPSIGDLNDDGYQDIAVISYIGNPPWFNDGTFGGMKVFGWNGRNGAKLFETPMCDSWNKMSSTASSTIIGSVGHGTTAGMKILFGHIGEVGVLTGQGSYYTDSGAQWSGPCKSYPSATDLTYWTDWLVRTTPAMGDIDGDGKVEVVVGSSSYNDEYAKVFSWEPGASVGALPWPVFRQNRFNTGNASTPKLTASTTNLVIPFSRDGSLPTPELRVTNGRGGSILSWSATVAWSGSAGTDWFTLNRASGETATFDTVKLSLKPTGLQNPGTYRAQITLKGAAGTEGSPLVVEVSYVVPGPTLEVAPNVLWVLMDSDGPTTSASQVLVRNAGSGSDIEWHISSGSSWLSSTPSMGSTLRSPELTVVANRSGLRDGQHTGTMTVVATTPQVTNPEQVITVHLVVGQIHRVFMPTVGRGAR